MARLRRPVSAAIAGLIVCGLLASTPGVAGATTVDPAPVPSVEGGSEELSVAELDLDGVETAVLPELPDPAAVPFAEDEAPAQEAAPEQGDAAARRTAEEPAPTAAPPAEPDAQPTPAATPGATPSGTPTEAPAEVPAEAPAAEAPADPDVLTVEMDTAPFSVLGVTWDRTPGLDEVEIRYRVRVDGTWTDWQGAEAADVAPDADSQDAESDARDGTDPIVAVGADGVQIWAQAGSGTVTGLKAVLVDPGADPVDVGALAEPADGAAVRDAAATGEATFQNLGTATTSAVRTAALGNPGIISRAGWGADESMRGCQPDYSRQVVSAAVHHTASANGYSAAEVPGILRGFYAYHTRPEAAGGRGWCDIGYNFLVDQFGRIFEGRAGGIESTVVGVHTGGFNSRTIGVAAIGNYQTTAPSGALLESISQLIAWKFAVHRIQAGTSVSMVSGGGASKYPAGTVVSFPTIYAHRDAQLTSCPGQGLYDRLPDIRNRVAQLANATVAASPRASLDSLGATSAGIAVKGWAFDPGSSAALPVRVSVDGAVQQLTANQSRPDVAAAHGVGANHGFAGSVSAGNGRHLVCVSVGNVGAGQDVVLGCDWVTVQNATPIGSLDAVTSTTTSISVRGWALDPDTTASIGVHVYVDGTFTGALVADQSRPDVAAAHGKGDKHGFSGTLQVAGGLRQVCLYAINQPKGSNPRFACANVQVGHSPGGALDSVVGGVGQVTVRGWALDKDTRDPIQVHAYVDNKRAAVFTADKPRPDVGRAHGMGDNHGFEAVVPVPDGTHRLCLYLINTPSGSNPELRCQNVTVRNAAPIGRLDSVVTSPSGARLTGWALDPDTTASIGVHVYVDGRFAAATVAQGHRPDVDAAYRKGAAHGYDLTVAMTAGTHEVCLYGLNQPKGGNPKFACRAVTVVNAAPIGRVDSATPEGAGARVRGWSIDPDTAAPVAVHFYVDRTFAASTVANTSRPDVDAVYGQGVQRGFDLVVPMSSGTHQVCAHGINQPAGSNPTMACRAVTVP
jgi:hypothetical protein